MEIEYILDEEINLYTVKADGEILLECLSEAELDALSIGEIKRLAQEVRA